jgi:hypothetical protein
MNVAVMLLNGELLMLLVFFMSLKVMKKIRFNYLSNCQKGKLHYSSVYRIQIAIYCRKPFCARNIGWYNLNKFQSYKETIYYYYYGIFSDNKIWNTSTPSVDIIFKNDCMKVYGTRCMTIHYFHDSSNVVLSFFLSSQLLPTNQYFFILVQTDANGLSFLDWLKILLFPSL